MSGSTTETGRLTTHVLDTAHGRPAANLKIELYRLTDEGRDRLIEAVTNQDGRCPEPLLAGARLMAGQYEILFHVGDYFEDAGVAPADPSFLGVVPVRFGIAEPDQHYHVPLLVSPFGYATYRGS